MNGLSVNGVIVSAEGAAGAEAAAEASGAADGPAELRGTSPALAAPPQ